MTAAIHLFGWLALALLVASLALSLVARRQRGPRRVRSLSLRRSAGLAGAAVAVGHASLSVVALRPPDAATLVAMIDGLPYLRHGALAVALLVPLVVTSFPRLNARLGLRGWGALHRVVYAAVALAALHVLAGPSADPRLAVVTSVVVALLVALRLVPRPRPREEGAAREGDAVTTGPADSP